MVYSVINSVCNITYVLYMLTIFSFNSSYILMLLPLFLAHMDLVERG